MGQTFQDIATLFPSNLHPLDRVARLVLGAGMFAVGWLAGEGPVALAFRVFAFYPLVTSLVSWCPIYALLRYRTNR